MKGRCVMQISELGSYPILKEGVLTKVLTNNEVSDLSFSSLFEEIIADKTVLAKESAGEEKSKTTCDCDQGELKCACDSEKDMKAILESEKKSGIEACMDCENRKNGQCALWNEEGENDPFAILALSSRDNSITNDSAKMSDIQAKIDVMTISSLQFDYTNAYAYAQKRDKYTENGQIE